MGSSDCAHATLSGESDTMLKPQELVKDRLKEIERAFTAFERGDRNRLYETRDSLLGLTSAIEGSEVSDLAPLSEIASRLLGLVIMEGGLTETRAVQVVRDMLGFVEAQLMEVQPSDDPGGVFHVVNAEKVGDMLVRKNILSPDQIDKALLLQRVSKGRRIGQVLVAMNAIDQRTLDDALNEQKSDTRRAETRRGAGAGNSTLGQRAIPLAPIPQMPPVPPAPNPSGAGAIPPMPGAQPPVAPPGPLPGLTSPPNNDHKPNQKLGLDWLDNK